MGGFCIIGTMKTTFADQAAWAGTVCLMAAPYIITDWRGVLAAAAGLTLLIPQAWNRNLWNLVALDVVGVLGYTLSLARML